MPCGLFQGHNHYDLADGQLAHAAGGTPSKPHEWMVSNLLSPYSSTLAMHAQSDSGGCGKPIVSGFKNQDEQDKTCIAHAGLASIKDGVLHMQCPRPAHQQLPLIGRQRRQTRSGASMARGTRVFSPAVQSAPWSYESTSNDVQMMPDDDGIRGHVNDEGPSRSRTPPTSPVHAGSSQSPPPSAHPMRQRAMELFLMIRYKPTVLPSPDHSCA